MSFGRRDRDRDDDGYYRRDRRDYDNNRRIAGYSNDYDYVNNGGGRSGGRSGPSNREPHKGHCIWFNKKRGYGFLKDESGGDYFIHATNILDAPFLIPGAQIRFTISRSSKGWFARNVELRNEIECYKCGGKAHFARDCVTR